MVEVVPIRVTTRLLVVWALVASAFVVSFAGCSFDPGSSPDIQCAVEADCPSGQMCTAGICHHPDQVPDVSMGDGGGGPGDAGDPADTAPGDGGEEETDMLPDLPESEDGGGDDGGDGDDAGDDCNTDEDGDGFYVGSGCTGAERDCNDQNDAIYPGAPTVCDGEDNDCDGLIDGDGCDCVNGSTETCGSNVGICTTGTRTCTNGEWGDCMGHTPPGTEVCDGQDNDCDGTKDEGCSCQTGESQECGTDVGECSRGTQTCENGTWGECQGGTQPAEEVCDGLDNDCNGVEDDSPTDVGQSCQTGIPGICSDGTMECVNGNPTCVQNEQARPEQCNDLDDDCDGNTDEGLTQACTTACGPGTEVCDSGSWVDCTPNTTPDEICDGKDNDCDGDVDETFPDEGMTCQTSQTGSCGTGTWVCDSGTKVCEVSTGGTSEVCDGKDNDCDGVIDEAPDGTVLTEECSGMCPSNSVRICQGGSWSPCSHTEVEVCNGADSNCDTATDNQSVCYQICPDGTPAPGTRDCSTGTCTLPDEICGDGLDNDCDGDIDQGCDSDLDSMAFIPGGTFLMGSRTSDPYTQGDETPIHIVELDPYYIDRHEVSRTDYATCVASGGCSLPGTCTYQPTFTQGDKPVVCVSHQQAQAYCTWRGARLPTEAEWEKGARGPYDRDVLWPWGDTEDSTKGVFDCSDSTNNCVVNVDTYPQGESYYGLRHMAGNVAEWVSDYYDPTFYTSGYVTNPEQTSDQGLGHVIRGGAFSQSIAFGRVANRARPSFLDDDEVGFRCAKSL